MSIAPTVRVTGTVADVTVQSGSKNGTPWTIRTARVLVGKADLCEVQLGDSQPDPAEGEAIDWKCRLSARGGYLTVRAAGPWNASGKAVKSVS